MPVQINQEQLSETFRNCVQKTLEEHCLVVFTKDPKVEKFDIIEYESRMRVFGLEKFNDTCYIGVLNLFESPLELERKDTCGVLLVYIKEENAEKLFKALMRGQDGEDDELILQNVERLTKAIFERLRGQAGSFGYPNLLAGKYDQYLSNVEEGVDFPFEEETLIRVSCTLWREIIVVAELVLAPAQHG